MRILFLTLRMWGSSGVSNALWWGAVDSGGARMTTSCYSETNCSSECSGHPPAPFSKISVRKRGAWDSWRGYFWTCVVKATGAVPGLDVGGHNNPPLRSPPTRNMVDWQPELLPSECGALSKRDGLLLPTTLHQLGWHFLRTGLLSETLFLPNPSLFLFFTGVRFASWSEGSSHLL